MREHMGQAAAHDTKANYHTNMATAAYQQRGNKSDSIPADDSAVLKTEAQVPDEPLDGEGVPSPNQEQPAGDAPVVSTEGEPVEKRGAKYSKATRDAIRKMRKSHGMYKADMEECMKAFADLSDEDDDSNMGDSEGEDPEDPREKAARPDDLQKVEALAKLSAERDALLLKVADLEKKLKEPAPAKGVVNTAGLIPAKKDNDGTLSSITKSDDLDANSDDPLVLMKLAQSKPRLFPH
jgi:hypothetical protein